MPHHLWSITEAEREKPLLHEESQALGYTVGLLTWMIAGTVIVAVKWGIGQMPPWTFCFWRVLFSALVLVPLVASHHRAMGAFLRSHWPSALFIGAIGLGLTQGTLFTALKLTSAINVGIIFATSPILTLVLARLFLDERMSLWQALGSLIAFSGIVVIAVQGSLKLLFGLQFGFGEVVVLGAALMFAGYTVLLKRAKFKLERLPLLCILLFGGAFGVLPFYLWEIWAGEHANLAFDGYVALAYTVTIGGAVLYLCFNWSIDILGAARAGTLLYSQMIFTAFFAWLLLGESLAWYHLLGAALIIIGILLVTLMKPKAP